MRVVNTIFPLLRFRSALHCGYSGITHDACDVTLSTVNRLGSLLTVL